MSDLDTQSSGKTTRVDFVQRHLANCAVSVLLGFGVFLLVLGGWHPGAFTQLGANVFLYDRDYSQITEVAISSGGGAAFICFALLLLWQPDRNSGGIAMSYEAKWLAVVVALFLAPILYLLIFGTG